MLYQVSYQPSGNNITVDCWDKHWIYKVSYLNCGRTTTKHDNVFMQLWNSTYRWLQKKKVRKNSGLHVISARPSKKKYSVTLFETAELQINIFVSSKHWNKIQHVQKYSEKMLKLIITELQFTIIILFSRGGGVGYSL